METFNAKIRYAVKGFSTPARVHLVRKDGKTGKPLVCVRFEQVTAEHTWVIGGCFAAFLNVSPDRLTPIAEKPETRPDADF